MYMKDHVTLYIANGRVRVGGGIVEELSAGLERSFGGRRLGGGNVIERD